MFLKVAAFKGEIGLEKMLSNSYTGNFFSWLFLILNKHVRQYYD